MSSRVSSGSNVKTSREATVAVGLMRTGQRFKGWIMSKFSSIKNELPSTAKPTGSQPNDWNSPTTSEAPSTAKPTESQPKDWDSPTTSEGLMNMPKSTTSPWCKSTNPEPTSDSQEDSLKDRMVSGNDTTIDRHPYQLALEGGGSHNCGGCILTVNWALTAAHCVHDQPLKWLAFRAGSTLREEGGTVHHVKFYVIHEKYSKETLDYDVAVVFVNEPFRYDNRTSPITLPSLPYEGGVKVEATGWGYKQKSLLTKPKKLQRAAFVTQNWNKCLRQYPGQLTERMMCAEDPYKIADICQGDSGGPLVIKGTSTVVGLVSWSYACADGRPSVYTNVFSVTKWIRREVNNVKDQYLCD